MSWQSETVPQNAVPQALKFGADRAESRPFSASGAAASAGGGAPLGKRGNSLTPPLPDRGGDYGQDSGNKGKNKGRRDLVADQRRAASIYWTEHKAISAAFERGEIGAGEMTERIDALPARGVTMCGWTQIADTETALMRQARPDGHHAYLSGLQMCGLRWVCPICTAKAAQSDRQDVNDGLAAARGMGLFPVMVTLTTRHRRGEAAADVLAGIIKAEQGLKQVKAWRRIKAVMAGYARVLEWTHGQHGHHPHFHTILLLRAASEAEAIAMAETLHGPYMRQLAAAGRDGESRAAWQHSFQAQGAAAAESYITKWGSAEELTGTLAKAGDGENLTPWQLLRLSRTAPDDADRRRYAAIWWEIIEATKGRAQLYKSEGWRDLVALWRSMQPEVEPEPEPETVLTLGRREKRRPASPDWEIARNRTISLREAAESVADIEAARSAAREALENGLTDAEIIRAMRNDDDPGPLIEQAGSGAQLRPSRARGEGGFERGEEKHRFFHPFAG